MSTRLPLMGIAALLLTSSAAFADSRSLAFDVDNQTGYTLIGLRGSPSNTSDWGDNFLSQQVAHGDTVSISISDARTCEWDFRYEFSDKDTYEEYKINLCDIDGESFVIQ